MPEDRETAGESEATRGDDRVNLSEASSEDLQTLFGIGPAIARSIVHSRDRELGGILRSVHDSPPPGVGESRAELITRNAGLE